MELRDLRYFVAVADCEGFSRAAERLGISQPALSRQIIALESELGVRLFDRVGRRTLLTAAGDDLLVRGHALLHEAEAIKHRAHELGGGSAGVLRLGATPQSFESFVARLLTHYRRAMPDVEINLMEEGAAALIDAVRIGSIHLAVASLPPDTDLHGQLLFPIGVMAVVPKTHPLKRRKTIEIAELAPHQLLLLRKNFLSRQLFDRACVAAHVNPRILLDSNSANSLLALVGAGQGIAILPSTVRLESSPQQRVVPLRHGKPIGMWMSVIWHPKRYLTPAARLFIETAQRLTRRRYPGRALCVGDFERPGMCTLPDKQSVS
jgi:DNA-binding transcriptional LysR family regulator